MWESPVLLQRRQQHSGCIPGVNISSSLRFPLHDSPDLQRAGCKQRAGAHIDLSDGSTEALSRGAAGPSQPAKVATRGDTKHRHSPLFQAYMARVAAAMGICASRRTWRELIQRRSDLTEPDRVPVQKEGGRWEQLHVRWQGLSFSTFFLVFSTGGNARRACTHRKGGR